MKNRTKRFIFTIGTSLVVVLLIASAIILYRSISPLSTEHEAITNVAKSKTPINKISKYYRLNRDVRSFGLVGQSKSGKKYYFIYLPKSKKGYLYDTKQGVSEKKIINTFNVNHPKRIIKVVNLGWYQKKAVWEVSYSKTNGKIGFVIYNFDDGSELSYIDNL